VDYFFLGDAELVTAFRFIGVAGMAVENSSDAVTAFRRITEGFNETAGLAMPDSLPVDCRVLIITEAVASWLGDFMIDWQMSGHYPLLVEIPGMLGKLPGKKTLVDAIREAIGIQV
jgi:V/A-type H+-transporting ATPase subunit F